MERLVKTKRIFPGRCELSTRINQNNFLITYKDIMLLTILFVDPVVVPVLKLCQEEVNANFFIEIPINLFK